MAAAVRRLLTSTFCLILLFHLTYCWDNDDLEIFDLVEEVDENFYQVIGVEQSATTSEIKKAFRRLTLRYHPDKNDEADAGERFRKLAAIYEVLKDEKKREKYNQVLVDGLPDWKQPVYYFRRARKMSMVELVIVLSLIVTIGQYCVFWGIFIEKHLVLDDMLSSKKKKKTKKSKLPASDGDVSEEMTSIPLPRFLDLWPFQLSVFLFYSVYNLPTTVREWKEERELRKEEEEQRRIEEEEERRLEEEERKELARKPKKRIQPELPEYSPEMYAKLSVPATEGKQEAGGGLADMLQKISQAQDRLGEEWTDEELVLLAKAVRKYPGGTTDRWEKIAEMVGRSVTEVTNKSKESKGSSFATKVNPSVQGLQSSHKSLTKISDEIITHNLDADLESIEDDQSSGGKVRKRKKNTRTVEPEKAAAVPQTNNTVTTITPSKGAPNQNNTQTTDESSSNSGAAFVEVKSTSLEGWTQNQQKILEWALKQYPKGTDRRWDRVAEHIPGKTKEECITRFKELAELISQKKKLEMASKCS